MKINVAFNFMCCYFRGTLGLKMSWCSLFVTRISDSSEGTGWLGRNWGHPSLRVYCNIRNWGTSFILGKLRMRGGTGSSWGVQNPFAPDLLFVSLPFFSFFSLIGGGSSGLSCHLVSLMSSPFVLIWHIRGEVTLTIRENSFTGKEKWSDRLLPYKQGKVMCGSIRGGGKLWGYRLGKRSRNLWRGGR